MTVRNSRSVLAASLLLGLTFEACTSSPGGADSAPQGSDGALDAAPCRTNQDCDDQLYCNGAERCVPGNPSADSRGCVSAGRSPCAEGQLCVEAALLCVTPDGGADGSATEAGATEGGASEASAPDAASCDEDHDGVLAPSCGGSDCDDRDPYTSPMLLERCDGTLADGRSAAAHDEDCNPCTVAGAAPDGDHDGDGYAARLCSNPWRSAAAPVGCDASHLRLVPPGSPPDPSMPSVTTPTGLVRGTDCDDGATGGSRHPNQPELCNGQDDNCDDIPDNLDPLATAACGTSPDGATLGCNGARCVVRSCPAGRNDCDLESTNGCESDPATDVNNCGSCGNVCTVAGGTAACARGACGVGICGMGLHACGGACVDNAQVAHCGSGCAPCAAPLSNGVATCVAGSTGSYACGMQCNTGYHLCGADCVSDAQLASCGARCAPCVAPSSAATGTVACAGSPGSYACATQCVAGYHVCGTDCLSNTDVASCGARCTPCTPPANGTAVCAAGACDFQCNAGYLRNGTLCDPGPRLTWPATNTRMTTRRPLFRWVLPVGATGAQLSFCADRACRTVLATQSFTGTSGAPSADLPTGIVFVQARSVGSAAVQSNYELELWIPPVAASPARDAPWGYLVDLDADGFTDLLEGCPGANSLLGMVAVGWGRAVSAGPTPVDLTLNYPLMDFGSTGFSPPQFGNFVAARPLPNGYMALDAGAPGWEFLASLTTNDVGRVLTFAAPTGRNFSLTAMTSDGGITGMTFYGTQGAIVGDANGDGVYELATTATGSVSSGVPLALYSAPINATTLRTPPSLAIAGGPGFGLYPLAGAVDLDGDGYHDMVVPSSDRVTLYFGSSTGFGAPVVLLPPAAGEGFGSDVAVGDFDGDGLGELVVGASAAAPSGLTAAGRLYYYNFTSRAAPTPSVLNGTAANQRLGSMLAGSGNIDNDCCSDLLVAHPSGVQLFRGQLGGATLQAPVLLGVPAGRPVLLGDFNGDHIEDWAVSATDATRVYAGPTSATPAAAFLTVYAGSMASNQLRLGVFPR